MPGQSIDNCNYRGTKPGAWPGRPGAAGTCGGEPAPWSGSAPPGRPSPSSPSPASPPSPPAPSSPPPAVGPASPPPTAPAAAVDGDGKLLSWSQLHSSFTNRRFVLFCQFHISVG